MRELDFAKLGRDCRRENAQLRHCERSEAIQSCQNTDSGLLRRGACHRTRIRATRWLLAMTDMETFAATPRARHGIVNVVVIVATQLQLQEQDGSALPSDFNGVIDVSWIPMIPVV
jgi:hypothetical protein